ncbi:ABC transporter substrate-binding protein [Vibrio toranzoniae]|jgi:iron complex transport system substrate-binding protein|uniref:Ferric anguibactin-binding protein n=1 Tax=Vibrio toranzoniae TaxID=1194427 RepID=A0A109D4W2_9VIBR|nr:MULTISPECIES: ABC transporter substrate-binding protein [Vibrio]KWT98961.1 ferric anguibactin-binding protein [Vibrio toranzoniae]MDA0145627.1 ABC transporter substrate-binding protein [Vibrio sp. RW]NAZ46920.1 ABC transporter substrate-binding protein [Vibrio toranzoniae]NAZ52102.1 ABC transporter substrate-binding protein [Vibrio toranzoniae]NAZ98585.1 ABC transporter substrate-binding protein [Vibrio toranzoniae]
MKKIINSVRQLLSGLAVALSFTMAVQAETVTVEHVKGTAQFAEIPQRVVVLGFGSLDVLDKIGVKPVGAPHSLMPDYLESYKETTANTGSLSEPDFEAIYMLKPDVIIAENRMLKVYDKLAQIAPTIMFSIEGDKYWADAQENWRALGQLFDKQAEVEAIIEETQTSITAVNDKVASEQTSAMMLMNNGNNIAMFNKGSRFSIIFDDFGFVESKSAAVAPIKGSHGNLISFEYIADAKPEVLYVLDREKAIGKSEGRAQQLFNNPLVAATPAAQKGNIVYLDSSAWYLAGGGVTAIHRMLGDIERTIQ